jgi:predicted ATPase/DNA-binding SARP family transcriptional activator/Tfp pilus assembly protein PilF
MEFRLLGPLEVRTDGGAFGVGAHKPRALLAFLLVHANEIVPADRLIEALWDGSPPASATKLLQTYVSQLRKELGRDRIVTRDPGYLVSVARDELDIERFERLRTSRPHEALALWRGAPLADFEYDAWAQPEIARLAEARLGTIEERIDLDLVRGRHGELVAELETLVDEHPLRERLRGRLMLALYRCGRQAEALAVYRDGRRLLADDLGIEPSASLQQLERSILRQDAALDLTAQPPAAEPERLIGREDVLRQIAGLLESVRLTTLTGPGGIGKTRLALEVSTRSIGRYADGVVVVELAALADPDLLAAEVARSLGVPDPSTESLTAYLRAKELLLVLDNFEQVAPAAPLLEQLLDAAPRLSLLVTSRTPLHLTAEARYQVPPLQLPDPTAPPPLEALAATEAVALFVARAREARPEFELLDENAGAVSELCLRLDGLPLALELAGARANLLSPSAILSRLGRRLDLLRVSDAHVSERHRTMRAAIEWSYDLLRPAEQTLFSSLAIFSGSFSADGAEALAGGGVLDGLGALLDSSLVRSERPVGDEPRLGMLETIREYALERLAQREDEPELRRRHADFYCALAERAEPGLRGPEQILWLRRLDADRENLRTVLGWAVQSGDVELGLRTASSLWRYWQVRGGLAEGRAHLERLLAVEATVPPSVRAEALAASGRLAFMHGHLESAQARVEESLALASASGNGDPSRALSLTVLAMVASARGDQAHAEELLGQSLEIARARGDWFTHALALIGRGDFLYVAGEFEPARRSLEEGLRAAREVGDLRQIGRGLTALGTVALEQREFERATQLLAEALAVQRDLGDRWGVPRALVSLGVAALGRGDDGAAERFFEQGLRLQLEVDDRPGIAASLEQIAALRAQRHDVEAAACLFGAAGILREMVGTHPMHLAGHRTDEMLAGVKAGLDPDVFADAWSRGRSMTLDAAVAYALDTTRRRDDVHYAVD